MQRLSTRHAGTANDYGLVGLASFVQDASTLEESGRSDATSDSLGLAAHVGWRVVSAFARSCVILALLAFCVPGSSAQGGASKLRVATRVVPPMVIEDKGALRGFSIDLWNSISARLNRETEYLVMSDVGEVLDAVGDGRADLGIAAISITSEREIRFDFSQPILNAGLQILVRGAAGNAEPSPVQLMRLFFSRTLIWLGIALLMIMIPAASGLGGGATPSQRNHSEQKLFSGNFPCDVLGCRHPRYTGRPYASALDGPDCCRALDVYGGGVRGFLYRAAHGIADRATN